MGLRTFADTNCTENQNIMSEKPRSPRPFKSNSNKKFSDRKPSGISRSFDRRERTSTDRPKASGEKSETHEDGRSRTSSNIRRDSNTSHPFRRNDDSTSRPYKRKTSFLQTDRLLEIKEPGISLGMMVQIAEIQTVRINSMTEKTSPIVGMMKKRTSSASRYGKSTFPRPEKTGRAIINYRNDDAFQDKRVEKPVGENSRTRDERTERPLSRERRIRRQWSSIRKKRRILSPPCTIFLWKIF